MLEREEPDALAQIEINDDDYDIVANQLEKQRQLKIRQKTKTDFLEDMLKKGKSYHFPSRQIDPLVFD